MAARRHLAAQRSCITLEAMPGAFLICFTSPDGEEQEERWPSVEAFRNWAISQGSGYRFTAYQQDDDEWVVVEQGLVGSRPRPT